MCVLGWCFGVVDLVVVYAWAVLAFFTWASFRLAYLGGSGLYEVD